jgi:hypothetical protein
MTEHTDGTVAGHKVYRGLYESTGKALARRLRQQGYTARIRTCSFFKVDVFTDAPDVVCNSCTYISLPVPEHRA